MKIKTFGLRDDGSHAVVRAGATLCIYNGPDFKVWHRCTQYCFPLASVSHLRCVILHLKTWTEFLCTLLFNCTLKPKITLSFHLCIFVHRTCRFWLFDALKVLLKTTITYSGVR